MPITLIRPRQAVRLRQYLLQNNKCGFYARTSYAAVAELVDALASGASGGNPVEVQVLSSAPRARSSVG